MTAKQRETAEQAQAEMARRAGNKAAKKAAQGGRHKRVEVGDIGLGPEWLSLGKLDLQQMAVTGEWPR